MSQARREFMPWAEDDYLALGARKTCKIHLCRWLALRRWLVERGVEISRQGGRYDRSI